MIAIAFGLVLIGWWIPLVPAVLALVLNGAGLVAATFYRYEKIYEQDCAIVKEYATETTRITVICAEENSKQSIRVLDNRKSRIGEKTPERVGRGTQQAKTLARHLRGTFQRLSIELKGTRCELSWVVREFRFWEVASFGNLSDRD